MLLLLAALLRGQDLSAADEFRKIDEALQKAKTVTLKYRCDVAKKDSDKAEILRISGTIALKGDDKAALVTEFDSRDPRLTLTEVSDGVKLLHRLGLGSVKEQPAPKALRPSLEYAFSRLGIYYPSVVTGTFLWSHSPPKEGPDGYARLAEVSKLKMEPELPGGRIISFQVKARPRNPNLPGREVDVRLLYSPKTHLPIKRIVTVGGDGTSYSIAEMYDIFTVDEPIPEEAFTLEEKK